MTQVIKNFINRHDEQIDDSAWLDLFYSAWGQFSSDLVNDIIDILSEVEDKDTLQLDAICAYFKWRKEYELNSPFNVGDKSSSWSRLNWLLDACPYFDQNYEDVKQAIFDNKDWIGVTLTPLEDEYSWNGSKEYDLGFFDERYYKEET